MELRGVSKGVSGVGVAWLRSAWKLWQEIVRKRLAICLLALLIILVEALESLCRLNNIF